MILWLTLLPLVSALPLEYRAANTACGKFDMIPISSGSYTLLTNLWGGESAVTGSQCSVLKSASRHIVTWATYWTWEGEYGVKSFSNIQLNDGINKQLGAINNMPSTWHWSQRGSGQVVSDVAYDFFTSDSPGGSNVHEVMVWLGKFNAKPISHEYDYSGQPLPIETSLAIAGYSWDLYSGSNGYNAVYSFLPTSGAITSFSGDVYEFFRYMIDNGYISSLEYLKTAQAGTEATYGSATLETSAYKLAIN